MHRPDLPCRRRPLSTANDATPGLGDGAGSAGVRQARCRLAQLRCPRGFQTSRTADSAPPISSCRFPGRTGFTTSIQVDRRAAGGQRDYTVTSVLDKIIANPIPRNGTDADPDVPLRDNRIDRCERTSQGLLGRQPRGLPDDQRSHRRGHLPCEMRQRPRRALDRSLGRPPAEPTGPGVNECTDPMTNPAVVSMNSKLWGTWRQGQPRAPSASRDPWAGGGGWR